jgi:glyoxylase-like metal-dependent hydrolase (beta-lactamase superfamily II)
MKKSILILLMAIPLHLHLSSQSGNSYQIFALRFATDEKATPISALAMNGPEKDSMKLVSMIWLIQDKHRNILVDAGFQRDITEAKDLGMIYHSRPDSILAEVGLKASDISDIILTHPHWDHIDGIDLFPNAHIWFQKEDFNYFVGEAWQKDGNHGGFNKRDVAKIVQLNLEGRVTLVNGDNQDILPGIKVFTGSRHTYNSQYVLVNTGNSKVILASDNIWIYYNLDHLVSIPGYATFDPPGYVSAMKRMKVMASDIRLIVPGHDPEVFSRFPKRSENVVQIK